MLRKNVAARLLPALLLSAWFSTPASAQTPLTTVQVATGLNNPVLITSAPDDDRMFVLEQPGRIRIIKNGSLLPTPFLDITGKVKDSGNEQGLLSLAFHPDYANNGRFYVYYTGFNGSVGNVEVERYEVSAGDPDIADPLSVDPILGVVQPFNNHNGGHMAFGPDGMLYIGTGDGGSANDPGCRAQDLSMRQGKMLRIDVDVASGFAVPTDNPFFGTGGAANLVWHLGLRNPYRWSFDRVTGEMYIGDVGQDAREEVSYAAAGVGGLNFGWKVMEGNLCNSTASCSPAPLPCNDPGYSDPIHTYNHTGGFGGVCSITGGYVYRGCAIPDLQGTYFFADVCTSQYWSFEWDGSTKTNFQERTTELAPSVGNLNSPVSFGEDRYGELYICTLGGGVYKLVADTVLTGTDCDTNGQFDVCEIAKRPSADSVPNSVLDVCETLDVPAGTVSIASGGTQPMNLHAGASLGGDFYWMFGSATGTSPGIDFGGGVVLPLNFDAYFNLTLTKPFSGLFSGFLSALDVDGNGSATLNVPGGLDPSLAGLTLSHAYLTSSVIGGADFASNPVQVLFVL